MFAARSFVVAPVLVVLLSGASHAALTADQVWQSWQTAVSGQGGKIAAATTARSGNALTLNGVSIGAGEGPALTISDMTLTELSDGTVEIKPGAAIGADMNEGDVKGSLKVSHDNLIIIASEGASGGIGYAFSADKLALALDHSQPGYAFNEEPAQPVSLSLTAQAEGFSGNYSDTPGDLRVFDFDSQVKKASYTVISDDPGIGSKSTNTTEVVDLKGSIDVAVPSSVKLAEAETSEEFRKALNDGLAVSASFSQGVSTMSSKEENEFMPLQVQGVMQPSTFDLAFAKDGLKIDTSADGGVLDFTSQLLPVPVKMTLGKMGFNLALPVMAVDEPEDYALKLNLDSVAVNEEAWGIVDPEGKIKHDPLTAVIDVTGKILSDWTAMGDHVPSVPQPQSLDINAVALQMAGAALTATGAFTFDNAMGMPTPIGNADVALKGVDQLVNGLIAVGVITEEDAMGARMMIGMFMVPGSEADSYVSKIEAKEGGSIFVNGQQVQ